MNMAENCELRTLVPVQNFLLETKTNSCYCNKLFFNPNNDRYMTSPSNKIVSLGAQVMGITKLITKVNSSDLESNSRN